jgi:hypothetical protein
MKKRTMNKEEKLKALDYVYDNLNKKSPSMCPLMEHFMFITDFSKSDTLNLRIKDIEGLFPEWFPFIHEGGTKILREHGFAEDFDVRSSWLRNYEKSMSDHLNYKKEQLLIFRKQIENEQ